MIVAWLQLEWRPKKVSTQVDWLRVRDPRQIFRVKFFNGAHILWIKSVTPAYTHEFFMLDLQDELIDFRKSSACKDMFEILSICQSLAKVSVLYPTIVNQTAFLLVLRFELGFFILV